MQNFSRVFAKEFTDLYQSHECLWKIRSKSYSDRDKKSAVSEKLIVKMREVDPEADQDAVART